MAEYTKEEIKRIEEKWRQTWEKNEVYKISGLGKSNQPKYYVLDMFPYPSGAGLHVGHPLGYIASDIVSRYKRLKGFNVLHPMGFDAFGLPAEQYAIEHGIHPARSTTQNIENFRRQLNKIGFSYDWSREVRTCDPSYYKWTQWIFLQIFDSWFNRKKEKAERISELIIILEKEGNINHPFPNLKFQISGKIVFSSDDWKNSGENEKQEILMQYRLAYLAFTDVNWCEALGTVLANDEVINGVSYRGGFPVIKKQMRQWSLRITEYAERLLKGLEEIDFSESMKDIQRNWIGKSTGAKIEFKIKSEQSVIENMTVFTTRPDTIFGVDFMVVAPEHEMVKEITSVQQKEEVEKYLRYVESRSEIDRMAEVKKITGAFTGAYAINPFNGNEIQIWISEYVLAGYGTGAIMGVPCGDERDHKFAKHFNLPITNIIGSLYDGTQANPTYDAVLDNSGFLNGLQMRDAIESVVNKLEEMGIGKSQVNYKMRDAGWSRQRYWGEPFPVVYRGDIPYPMDEKKLPLELPDSNDFRPSGTGEGPLANLKDWIKISESEHRDANTMPTHAGAAWYFLRFADPHNDKEFANRQALDYWGQVDVYVGGSEHAVAHLLYARLWVKILHDLGYLGFDEPFKKLINQGKITGESKFIYRIHPFVKILKSDEKFVGRSLFVSKGHFDKWSTGDLSSEGLKELIRKEVGDEILISLNVSDVKTLKIDALHVDINIVKDGVLDIGAFKKWKPDFINAEFLLEDNKYICGAAIEKMSKTYYNVVNPDDIIDNYGADTLRMYEMFLGPLEMSKPWNTNGIDGVFKFLRKFWNLFSDDKGNFHVSDGEPSREELKVLHKTLKKAEHDIENFSFNTTVSEFMICVNELTSLKTDKRSILEPLTIALAPFAPHISEELWEKLGHTETIFDAKFPKFNPEYLKQSSFEYPISINGKVRMKMEFALDMPLADIEKIVLAAEQVIKYTEGKPPKKVIVVQGRIVNVVL